MYGIIYKATNLTNGKVYIGQTTKSLQERILQHKKDCIRLRNRNITFYNAIKKYGFDNFNWCIIDQSYSRGELDTKECYWIEFYKSYIHHKETNGYNMTLGGDGLYGYKASKETIEKMLLSRKGYKHSVETRKKQSIAHMGKKKTDEHIENLSKSRIGRFTKENHARAKSVIQLSLTGDFISEYPTVTEASKSVNGSTTKISRCCMGADRHRTHKDYLWIYKEDYNEENIERLVRIVESKIKGRPTRGVVQLLPNSDFVQKFNSVKEAYESINGAKSSMIKCLKNKDGSYKGFKWMYEDDYNVRTTGD